MPILSSTDELKKHIGVSESFAFEDFEPNIDKAVIKYTYRFVGNLHEALEDEATGPDAEKLNKARYLLQSILANFGMFIYLPLGSVIFDGSGLSNASNQERTPLAWQQMNDLKRGFLSAGHEAMDMLLSLMEENKSLFTEWAESDLYTESKELLIDNTKAFNKWYNISESRQTYLALQPSLRQVEDQYLRTFICRELISHLKSGVLTAIQKEVKVELQKAMVAFTVAKVSTEGLFLIDATGLRIKYDMLSHESVQNFDYGKAVDFVVSTARQQEANGQQYLKSAKKIILDNLSEFNQCASPLIQSSAGDGWRPYNTSGVLGL